MMPMNPSQAIQAIRQGANPNQLIMQMAQQHPASAALYERALREFTPESLKDWISHLASLIET